MKATSTSRQIEGLVSAGGVVYRVREGVVEVALCGRRDPLRWSLPKGTPDQGETLEGTALREVREETGLQVSILEPIGNISYWFVNSRSGVRHNKTVHFYLMSPHGGSTQDHDPEFDEVRWFTVDEALRTLTFVNEVNLLDRALTLIRKRAAES